MFMVGNMAPTDLLRARATCSKSDGTFNTFCTSKASSSVMGIVSLHPAKAHVRISQCEGETEGGNLQH